MSLFDLLFGGRYSAPQLPPDEPMWTSVTIKGNPDVVKRAMQPYLDAFIDAPKPAPKRKRPRRTPYRVSKTS